MTKGNFTTPGYEKIFLMTFPLFRSLTNEQIDKLSVRMVKKNTAKYQYIFQPGEEANQVFLLQEGTVKITAHNEQGKEVIKSVVHSGAIVGDEALFGYDKFANFAQVFDSKATYYAMDTAVILEVMKENFEFTMELFRVLGRKMTYVQKRLQSLVLEDARSRIIEFLKDNVESYGQKVGYEFLLKHSFTQQDIADFTGTSRQTVTTVLNELKKDNVIQLKRKRILFRDLSELL